MEKSKLEAAAKEHYLDNPFLPWLKEDAFVQGAEWLQSQPLSDRFTEAEKEKIIGFYKKAEELETYGATESDKKEGRAFIVVFHSLFGKEMFENKE